jgi:hypothetical protein
MRQVFLSKDSPTILNLSLTGARASGMLHVPFVRLPSIEFGIQEVLYLFCATHSLGSFSFTPSVSLSHSCHAVWRLFRQEATKVSIRSFHIRTQIDVMLLKCVKNLHNRAFLKLFLNLGASPFL